MDVGRLVIAGVGAFIASFLLFLRWDSLRQLAVMRATATTKARDVSALAVGSIVEVKGVLQCAQPLSAEMSGQPCAYYTVDVTDEVSKPGSQGGSASETDTRQVYSNRQFAPCLIEDDSGAVALNLDGAVVEGIDTVNRDEKPELNREDMVDALAGWSNRTRHYGEMILPIGVSVYALGEVQADRSVGQPAKGSKNAYLLVSVQSKEERLKSSETRGKWFLIVACILLVGVAALLFSTWKAAH